VLRVSGLLYLFPVTQCERVATRKKNTDTLLSRTASSAVSGHTFGRTAHILMTTVYSHDCIEYSVTPRVFNTEILMSNSTYGVMEYMSTQSHPHGLVHLLHRIGLGITIRLMMWCSYLPENSALSCEQYSRCNSLPI
jgi:hypothetical protein